MDPAGRGAHIRNVGGHDDRHDGAFGLAGPDAVHIDTSTGRRTWSASLETAAFALGYAVVWAGFSAAATAIQWLLREAALLSESMAITDSYLSGSIMIAAGLYQLTTWKSTCLVGCRSPLGFLMSNWRAGKVGAFVMGARHGLFCLGCCWALMVVLFAVGVMNLLWVAALTVFILLEKVGPHGPLFARIGGVGLIGLGAFAISRGL